MAKEYGKKTVYPVLSILIPCILGIIGMARNGVSIAIWIQNPLAILLLSVACWLILKCDFKYNNKAVVFAAVLLLGLTFLGPNIEGVHRWLRLPFFTLNIAAMVIPIAIIALYRLVEERQFVISMVGITVIAVLLSLQPDASQLLAFSLPMMILLWKSEVSKIAASGLSGILVFLTAMSWSRLDALQPVDYTEGILTMLQDVSIVLYIVGLAALFCVPIYFLISCKEKNRRIWTGIAVYYWLTILSTFAGNSPVPFMGYGISPILGFYAVFIWFMIEDKDWAHSK